MEEIEVMPTTYKKKHIPKALKDKLWEISYGLDAGSGFCYVCNTKIYSRTFEAGHIIPESHGGSTTLDNLKCICSTCNKSMGTKNMNNFKHTYFPEKKQKLSKYFHHTKSFCNFPILMKYKQHLEKNINMPIIPTNNISITPTNTPCFLCHSDTFTDTLQDTPYFECCKIRVHKKGQYDCLEEYLRLFDKSVLRDTDCPKCLEKRYGMLERFEEL